MSLDDSDARVAPAETAINQLPASNAEGWIFGALLTATVKEAVADVETAQEESAAEATETRVSARGYGDLGPVTRTR